MAMKNWGLMVCNQGDILLANTIKKSKIRKRIEVFYNYALNKFNVKVFKYGNTRRTVIIDKKFTDKQTALKYANRYMKLY